MQITVGGIPTQGAGTVDVGKPERHGARVAGKNIFRFCCHLTKMSALVILQFLFVSITLQFY